MVETDFCSIMFILNIAGFSVAKYIGDLNLVKITLDKVILTDYFLS